MAQDINDEPEDNYDGGMHFGVFKEDIRVRQPFKDEVTRLLFMPAFADPNDPISMLPYRATEGELDADGNYRFTRWIDRYYAYQFIGPKGNQGHFLSDSLTYDDDSLDPVGKLVETARKDRRYMEITGLGPDGKKSKEKDAFMSVQLSPAEELYVVNAVCLNPAKEEDAGQSCVYSLRKTMVKGRHDVKTAGILAALKLQNRGVVGKVDPANFAEYYYWGDPTDIYALVPFNIEKVSPAPEKGKGKAFPYFDGAPDPKAQPVKGRRAMLESRYYLPDVLNKGVEPKETLDRLFAMFSDFPDLLIKAFERSYPGVDSLLRQAGVISESRVHQAGRGNAPDDDDLPMNERPTGRVVRNTEEPVEDRPARNAKPAPADDEDDLPPPPSGRSYAPAVRQAAPDQEEGDLPAPAKKPKAPTGSSEAVLAEAERIARELAGDLEKSAA